LERYWLGSSEAGELRAVGAGLRRGTWLAPTVRGRLAFARQKVDEVVLLSRALREGRSAVAAPFAHAQTRRAAGRRVRANDDWVRARLAALGPDHYHRGPAEERAAAQRTHLRLPTLPTTTIGSFPQTAAIRTERVACRAGQLDDAEYQWRMRAEIERVIRIQEDIGLDVLVHGEPERNDMVQYFAEHLDGFATTESGWVQSYGSRCVRPPVLYADVSRPEPITVGWSTPLRDTSSTPPRPQHEGPLHPQRW
jgi:5-methyltetrahydropteroyltriglutamate--homocysteine methyltransferase